jgi:flagellar biosynthesis/type III secretory pathway M-ring protein FliF/YscJ
MFFVLFISIFLSLLVIFFAVFPIDRTRLRRNHDEIPRRRHRTKKSDRADFDEIVYDDAEL